MGTKYRDADLPLRPEKCVPPFSAINYRRYAVECVRLAQATSDPVDKARPRDMAETFSGLAGKSETRNCGNPGS